MDSLEMNPIHFSVIIPTYNRKAFIKDAVDSILLNSNINFKLSLIVVDDGSTDETEEYLESYINEKKIIFLKIKNSERGFARNYGAEYSLKNLNPNYLIFFDSDDLMAPNSLFKFYGQIKNLGADKVFFARYQILNPDQTFGKTSPRMASNINIRNQVIFHHAVMPLGCTAIPSSVFCATEKFNENRLLSGSEDWLFLFEIALNHKIVPVDSVLTYYRQHEFNTNSQYFDRSLNLCLDYVESKSTEWALSKNELLGLKKQFTYNQVGVHNCDPKNGSPFYYLIKLTLHFPREIFKLKYIKYTLSVFKRKLLRIIKF